MRPRNALLLLSQAVALTLASDDDGLYAVHDSMDAEKPLFQADESNTSAGLGAALREQFVRSSELLQNFLRGGEPDNTVDVVRIVVIGGDEEEDPAAARKTACLKALATISEPKERYGQVDTILRYFKSAFGRVTPSQASCDDLGRPELVEECTFVVESQGVVQELLREGKTENHVCDVMAVVSDLKATDQLSCELCHRLVQMVTRALTQEVQEVEQVREIIGDLCDVTAADSMCHKFLINYDDIVEWLRHDTDPVVVCARLTMCPVDNVGGSETLALDWIGDDEAGNIADDDAAARDTHEQDSVRVGETSDLDWIFRVNARPVADDNAATLESQERSSVDREMLYLNSIFGDEARTVADDDVAAPDSQERTSMTDRETLDFIVGGETRTDVDGAVATPATQERGGVSDIDASDLDLIFGGTLRTTVNEAVATPDIQEQKQACSFCTSMVGVIAQVSTRFPDQLLLTKDLLRSVCQTASVVSNCQQVEAKFDGIVELVQQGQYPREVCGLMDLCTQQAELVIAPTDGKACAYCDAATTLIEVILQEAPEQINEIRDYADMICDMLGDDSPCHRYVGKLDSVIDLLNKGDHPRDICRELKYCSEDDMVGLSESGESPRINLMRDDRFVSSYRGNAGDREEYRDIIGELNKMILARHDEFVPHQPSIDYDSCFFCSHVAVVVHYIQRTSPEKLPIVKNVLSNVCQLVPSKCKCDVVDEKFDEVVKWDKEGKRPHDICKMLGTCKKTQEEDVPAVADELKRLVAASQWPPGDESECAYCQFATTVAKIAVEQYGADIRQVRAYADMICDMLGEDNPCHVYVKQMDFVIDSIAKGMSSKAICVGLEFCPAAVADDEGEALAWILEQRSPRATTGDHLSTLDSLPVERLDDLVEVSTDDGCFFCMQAAPVLEAAIAQDPSQIAKVRSVVDGICGMLPSNNQCHAFISKFDAVVESLRKGEQPKFVCHDLQLCLADSDLSVAESAAPEMMAVQKRDKESSACAYCNNIVLLLKYALDYKPEQVEEMREVSGRKCQLLPADDTCHKDLALFDEAVAGVQSGKEPQEICRMLELCMVVGDSNEMSGLLDFTGGDFLPTKCVTCQQNTRLLASLIDRPDSLATFEHGISTVCRLIPASGECDLMLKHQDAIIDLLKKNEDVNTICTRIGQCGAVAEKEQEKSMTVSCLFCEFIADLLEHAKDSERALSEAKATLETVCTVLPPQARCDVLSSKFDELLSLMREGKSPSEACHAATLCDAEFVFSPVSDSDEDPIVQSFDKARRSMGSVMEIE